MTHELRTNNRHADNARRLLRHYLRMVAETAGIRWDSDNEAEVGDIVDELLLAMWDEIENERDYLTQAEAVDVMAQMCSHLAECYACGTEIEVEVAHEDGAETAVTCPACGSSRTFAALRDEESGAWYAEDVTGAETDAIGRGVLTQAQE